MHEECIMIWVLSNCDHILIISLLQVARYKCNAYTVETFRDKIDKQLVNVTLLCHSRESSYFECGVVSCHKLVPATRIRTVTAHAKMLYYFLNGWRSPTHEGGRMGFNCIMVRQQRSNQDSNQMTWTHDARCKSSDVIIHIKYPNNERAFH